MSTELNKDIVELENIRKSATRGNVQTFLDETIKQWRLKLDAMEALKSTEEDASMKKSESLAQNFIKKSVNLARPLKKLATYAFDESDKFVKLYYTVPAITGTSIENVKSSFTDNSFQVCCLDVNAIDYEIAVKGLSHPIDAERSTVKIKSDDNLLVMLKKRTEAQTWKSLLKLEKTKETKVPDMDTSGDPQDSLMNMMKKMYDDGDDEMKRTIRKAWHESQSKKGGGDFAPSLDD